MNKKQTNNSILLVLAFLLIYYLSVFWGVMEINNTKLFILLIAIAVFFLLEMRELYLSLSKIRLLDRKYRNKILKDHDNKIKGNKAVIDKMQSKLNKLKDEKNNK